jgi:uncharacterized protein YdhG (YjbR/CyaY superfamily)
VLHGKSKAREKAAAYGQCSNKKIGGNGGVARLEGGRHAWGSCRIAPMKIRKAGGRSVARGQAKGAPKNVDAYLAALPEPARGTLNKIRAAIRSAAPAEAMEVISYGIPAFKHQRVLVWYAAFSDHCSFFPTAAVIAAFKKELAGYTTSKGTVQFSTARALPAALVKKMVKARIEMSR